MANLHEEGFNHKKVINPKRGIYSKWDFVWSKEEVVDGDCWNVDVMSIGKKTWQSFNLNCTKIYEWGWILWIIGAFSPYAEVLRTMIGKNHLILLHCLRLVAYNPYHSYQVLKNNLLVVLDQWSSLQPCMMSWLEWSMKSWTCLVLTWYSVKLQYTGLVLSSDQEASDHLTRLRWHAYVKGFSWSIETLIHSICQEWYLVVSHAQGFLSLNLKGIKVTCL